jgi:hypothetical protein
MRTKRISTLTIIGCLVIGVGCLVPGRAEAQTVTVTPSAVELEVGSSVRLVASIVGANGQAVTGQVRWFAGSSGVAVEQDGTVTALTPGDTRVAALFDGRPTWVDVHVPQLPVAEIDVLVDGERLGGAPLRVYEGTAVPVEAVARTRLGDPVDDWVLWLDTADSTVAAPVPGDRVHGIAPGRTELILSARGTADPLARVPVEVMPSEARDYGLRVFAGDVAGPYEAETGDVVRIAAEGITASGEIEEVRPLWTVSRNGATIESDHGVGVFVAEEPGHYVVTAVIGPEITRSWEVDVSQREHTARLELVGHGVTATHRAGDTWVFEGVDGRDYAYLGTFYHDWMKVWDVTDPTDPVLTDSIQLDARRINDVKIHPNNRVGILTREGASSRRNGIVMLDLTNPAHPEIISEYTDTVTGGVHNVWIIGEEDVVWAVHNGTSDIRILDIADPANVRQVGQWGLENEDRSLHDVIVQDGYAYASYWNDGVYILDAGAGTHGGTAREPTVVSHWVSTQGNTHVAWRHGKYLFIGSEIFPSDWDPEVFGPIEARGYVEVLDVTDLEAPALVATYEVPEAGAHNLWSDDRDRLYIGYYQAGLRVLDVSGELRGDLYRQGREIGAVKTSSPDGAVPNWSMTWGAQLHKGRIFTSDLFSGLWVLRLVERDLVP